MFVIANIVTAAVAVMTNDVTNYSLFWYFGHFTNVDITLCFL